MATNLRLESELESALKARAISTGRSQQDIIRDALREYLSTSVHDVPDVYEIRPGIRAHRPRTPIRRLEHLLPLPPGVNSSLELINREERFQ